MNIHQLELPLNMGLKPKLLTSVEAAKWLGISLSGLKSLRYKKEGPDYIRLSERNIRYRKQDLNKWIKGKINA